MSEQEIIESGNLELYVCGALSEKEANEVNTAVQSSKEVEKEVEEIEETLLKLGESVAPSLSSHIWNAIATGISGVRRMDTNRGTNWAAWTGWAAAILCVVGLFFMMNQNNNLEEQLQITTLENEDLQQDLQDTEDRLVQTTTVLDIIRSKEYDAYTLPGNQSVAPEAFAKLYYNRTENVAYIDTKGLPTPPRGKVYQAWSLIVDPLTPTSMGVMQNGIEIEEGIYKFEGFPTPEAIGITLEPEGGSESPTLEQLYILGPVTTP
ncbi:anti-sigma factor [Altibacter sp. HG106]|uniref:anti-sigma factor n=1 Tax=Altibacter sp. HG106 TaxID=3023937 RepID=UPI002350BD45|nr:anti-sigma factor [Altibacter sp. HG106]MDC7993858.1 anti-sigma factor [Altibacter sp. HG106]